MRAGTPSVRRVPRGRSWSFLHRAVVGTGRGIPWWTAPLLVGALASSMLVATVQQVTAGAHVRLPAAVHLPASAVPTTRTSPAGPPTTAPAPVVVPPDRPVEGQPPTVTDRSESPDAGATTTVTTEPAVAPSQPAAAPSPAPEHQVPESQVPPAATLPDPTTTTTTAPRHDQGDGGDH